MPSRRLEVLEGLVEDVETIARELGRLPRPAPLYELERLAFAYETVRDAWPAAYAANGAVSATSNGSGS